MPVEAEFLGDFRERRRSAAASDVPGEPGRAERIAREPVEAFGLHAAAPQAGESADREEQPDVAVAAGEIADVPPAGVMDLFGGLAAGAADSFWGRL